MKKKLINILFMFLMTIGGFILLPLEVLLFVLALIYIPFEFLYHKIKKLDEIKKYSPLETLFYKKKLKKEELNEK